METRKSKRSVRLALVLGAAVAGTALVGFGGLAAWEAYTQNSGNAFAVGTLSHTNTAGASVTCNSTTVSTDLPANCAVIVSDAALTSAWNAPLTGNVTITTGGSLNSKFTMSMPGAPAPVNSGDGNLCPQLTLTVTDNETPTAGTPYEPTSLSETMPATPILATNGHGTTASPWVPGDSGTYTFEVTPTSGYTAFDNNAAVLGSSCSFNILFTQASA
jgi:hypothetical protein